MNICQGDVIGKHIYLKNRFLWVRLPPLVPNIMSKPCRVCHSTIRYSRSDGRAGSCVNCTKINYDKLKREVIIAYGRECYCCGETEIAFLCVDHSFNDGETHRKSFGRGASNFYYWLRRNRFPKNLGLRVACANCNTATMFGRSCPHIKKG